MRSARVRRALGCYGLAVLAGGCSYYSASDGERLRDEVYALQTQVTSLRRKLADVESESSKSTKKLTRVSADVADLNTAARRNDADIGVVLDVVRQDVARMKGQVEGIDERLSSVEEKSAQTSEELDVRFQSLEEQEKIRAANSGRERTAAIRAAQARDQLLSNPKRALDRAESLLSEGRPGEARKLIRSLEIQQGRGSSWRTHAPRAQFLIGETYFAEKNFQQAAAAYNTVRKKYRGSSEFLPGSILKLGMCFERLGLKEDARLFYETVSKKYPRNPAAREAKRLIDRLDS